MGSKSPMFKVQRPVSWFVPDQSLRNEIKKERYNLWLEMKEKKKNRSLNNALGESK